MFQSYLIRRFGTQSALKDTQLVLKHSSHSESTLTLGGHLITWRAIREHPGTLILGHSEGIQSAPAHEDLGRLDTWGTEGTRALEAIYLADSSLFEIPFLNTVRHVPVVLDFKLNNAFWLTDRQIGLIVELIIFAKACKS